MRNEPTTPGASRMDRPVLANRRADPTAAVSGSLVPQKSPGARAHGDSAGGPLLLALLCAWSERRLTGALSLVEES